ncbi:zinc transporter [Trifolium repens]|nr:zinc transporter [Trifolium repens]
MSFSLRTFFLFSLLLLLFFFTTVSSHGGSSGDDDGDTDTDADAKEDTHDHNLRSKSLILAKVWCLIVIFFATFIAGVSPYVLRWNEGFLILGTQFAGGVFLGTALMHFLSDANETFGDLTEKEYPFAFMLACAGYLITMLADCVISSLLEKPHGAADVEGQAQIAEADKARSNGVTSQSEYQYTKGLLPKDYTVRTNKLGYTAGELFKRSYGQLIQDGSTWFKDTSESCSVVAALLAGVSFATSSTIPGGNNSETGKPTLEGRPAFDAFALSSVIGLCFSVTALVVFLSVLTSRKEPKDFRIDLPRKLLLGLSFLFLTIVAMITAFCSGNYFVLDHKYKHFVFLIYGYTCFPVTLYAIAQLPLYTDLLRGIVNKVPKTGDKGEDL